MIPPSDEAAERDVVAAAVARAAALVDADAGRLRALHHPDFQWSGTDQRQLGLDEYIATFTGGTITWRDQRVLDPDVVIVGDTAALFCTIEHDLDGPDGHEVFRRRGTQLWTRDGDEWRCLAAHAGHRLT